MCEFISWIEKDGKNYFLTSSDLASKRGRELREHCGNDDDLVGHGALRCFYGGFEGGVQKECTDFSSPSNFPSDIVEAIKEGRFRGMGLPEGLLNATARAEHDKIIEPARAEYEKIVNAAWAEYDKIVEPAWAEYDKIINAARAKREKIINAARAKRDKIIEPARAEYEKIVQIPFWDLFSIVENRSDAWK